MVKTFNTCADINIKYQKTLLGCKNKFTAGVTVGRGQVLLRLSIAKAEGFTLPPVPTSAEGAEWSLDLKRNEKSISNIKLKATAPTEAPIDLLSAVDTTYVASLLLVKADGSSTVPTEAQLEAAFGKLHPIAIVFEVV